MSPSLPYSWIAQFAGQARVIFFTATGDWADAWAEAERMSEGRLIWLENRV